MLPEKTNYSLKFSEFNSVREDEVNKTFYSLQFGRNFFSQNSLHLFTI